METAEDIDVPDTIPDIDHLILLYDSVEECSALGLLYKVTIDSVDIQYDDSDEAAMKLQYRNWSLTATRCREHGSLNYHVFGNALAFAAWLRTLPSISPREG